MDGDSKERTTAGIYVKAVQKHWRHADGHFISVPFCNVGKPGTVKSHVSFIDV